MPPMPPPPGIAGAGSFFGFGDHRLGGDEQAGDRGGVLQGGAHDLGRIDDALADHVDILFGLGVEAEGLDLFSRSCRPRSSLRRRRSRRSGGSELPAPSARC
jgi:hypothetical protein